MDHDPREAAAILRLRNDVLDGLYQLGLRELEVVAATLRELMPDGA